MTSMYVVSFQLKISNLRFLNPEKEIGVIHQPHASNKAWRGECSRKWRNRGCGCTRGTTLVYDTNFRVINRATKFLNQAISHLARLMRGSIFGLAPPVSFGLLGSDPERLSAQTIKTKKGRCSVNRRKKRLNSFTPSETCVGL
jgi:hypothetical protein